MSINFKEITEKDFEIFKSNYGYPLDDICLQLLNGEYTIEEFREDVLSWQKEIE